MYQISCEMKEKYIELLQTLCMVQTPSEDKKSLDQMTDIIERFAAECGYDTQRFSFPKAGDCLLIKLNAASKEKPVLLMAHMDTVHKNGAFGEKIVTRDGDFLHAPGAMDCKGGIVTGLCAMELLAKEAQLRRPVYFLLTSDEEVSAFFSGEEGVNLILDTAKQACAVFNLEPGNIGEVTVSRKGILRMSVEVTGVAAHAGNNYFEGASAVREAAHAVLEIEQMSQRGGPTFNCGVIKGGTTYNIVPDACRVDVDIRVSTPEEMAEAERRMQLLAEKSVTPNTKRSVSVVSKRPPMKQTEQNMELLKLWNTAAAQLGLPEYKGIQKGGGSDAAYTVIAGVPTLCSCGMVGFFAHTLREKVDLSTLDERVALLCKTITLL